MRLFAQPLSSMWIPSGASIRPQSYRSSNAPAFADRKRWGRRELRVILILRLVPGDSVAASRYR